jgi:hypothetical protein
MLQWLSLKPKLIAAGLILALLGIVYVTHKVIVYRAVNKAVAETKATMSAEYTKKLLEASELAREREQVMIASAERLRKDKDAQIASLNGRLGSALDGLRQRPQRSPSTPEGSPAACSCTGATGSQLSREDAEFLVREAARADSLRTALDQCYRQYDEVRKGLK